MARTRAVVLHRAMGHSLDAVHTRFWQHVRAPTTSMYGQRVRTGIAATAAHAAISTKAITQSAIVIHRIAITGIAMKPAPLHCKQITDILSTFVCIIARTKRVARTAI